MGKRGVYAYLAPAFLLQELVYPKLADGLEAYPLRTDIPRVCMLDGVHVNKALRLSAGLLKGCIDGINAAVVHHLTDLFFVGHLSDQPAGNQFFINLHRSFSPV